MYLGTDELMLKLFPRFYENYDEAVGKVIEYLKEKAVEICKAGANVVFDGAGWQCSDRQAMKNFFKGLGIPCELHYIDISNNKWQKFIANRNREVKNEKCSAYYIDDGLLQKCLRLFEPPNPAEVDVYVLDGIVKENKL